jgi:hypothetical protein
MWGSGWRRSTGRRWSNRANSSRLPPKLRLSAPCPPPRRFLLEPGELGDVLRAPGCAHVNVRAHNSPSVHGRCMLSENDTSCRTAWRSLRASTRQKSSKTPTFAASSTACARQLASTPLVRTGFSSRFSFVTGFGFSLIRRQLASIPLVRHKHTRKHLLVPILLGSEVGLSTHLWLRVVFKARPGGSAVPPGQARTGACVCTFSAADNATPWTQLQTRASGARWGWATSITSSASS